MPWNEPGNSSNNKDPWTGRPKQTPPDLEAFLRDLRKKIAAFFKLKALNKNTRAFTKTFLPAQFNIKILGLIFSALFLSWLFSGFFSVAPSEQAVITRFGKYHATLSQGHHWIFRPLETRYIISEKNVAFSYETNLLTRDENKVSLVIKARYAVDNARQYLFADTQSLQSLQDAIANATHQTLSQFSLAQLLTANLFSLQQTLQSKVDALLAQYATGLTVSNLEIQTIQAPEELKASFEEVTQAQAEKEQLENQAKTYALQLEPKTQGEAKNLIANAKNYQQEVILKAKAETARFLALLPAYEASPLLTRKRLYLDAMQAMMANSHKMLLDIPSNTSLSLNVDNMTKQSGVAPTTMASTQTTAATKPNTVLSMATPAKNDKVPSSYNITGGYE
ncbi:HflK protein [Candidatus Rickettsiella viridis]|uniref:Protein HflK n=1 Tax=Candidatus Rickettsiella viridis TaxID=676208 RepID=A0A2Z5V3M3_9COXI|nr:FtsH protease activity modulator HflK [Candidatus Rickettsiella viridis]BBB15052.1 HflK protein [Candidatus Rickettsiella viridis]